MTQILAVFIPVSAPQARSPGMASGRRLFTCSGGSLQGAGSLLLLAPECGVAMYGNTWWNAMSLAGTLSPTTVIVEYEGPLAIAVSAMSTTSSPNLRPFGQPPDTPFVVSLPTNPKRLNPGCPASRTGS